MAHYGGASYGYGSDRRSYGNSSSHHGSSSSSYGRDHHSSSSSPPRHHSSSSPPRHHSSSSPPRHHSSSSAPTENFTVGANGSTLYENPEGNAAKPAPGTIDFEQYDDIPVETSGRDAPQPILQWEESKLHPTLVRNVNDAGYKKPTPVQKYSIPIVGNNRDLMSCAQTGSGKTAAFLLPIISNILRSNEGGQGQNQGQNQGQGQGGYQRFLAHPLALVIAPTRELAIQINDEARKFLNRTGLRSTVVYGGSPIGFQLRELDRGCDLLVATPGRLVDILEKNKLSLTKIRYLVLDEADRMLDMGFEPQIRRIVERENMPRKGLRQTLMFSATFPREIQQLASSFLEDYIFLTIGRVGSTTELITQKFVEITRDADRDMHLMDLVRQQKDGLTLIFVETKRKANSLDYQLRRERISCTSIHGDRSQGERVQALRTFSSGQTPFLIATNVAARGLDISGVTHVINYEMPNNIDDYVHRIGRTGRAGKHGISTSFISASDSAVIPDLIDRLHDSNIEVPQWLESMRGYKKGASGGRGGGRGGRGGRGGPRFGGRDFRQDNSFAPPPSSTSGGSSSNGDAYGPPRPSYGPPRPSYPSYGQSAPWNGSSAPPSYPTYPPASSSSGGYGSAPPPNTTYGAYSAGPGPSSSSSSTSSGGYGGYSSGPASYAPQQNYPSYTGYPPYGSSASSYGAKRDRDQESHSDNKKPRYEERR